MNCDEALEKISRQMDGELPAEDRAAVEAHLAQCSACRDVRVRWASLSDVLREPPADLPPAEVMRADVLRAIRQLEPAAEAPAGLFFKWRLAWAGAMVAAVMALIGGLGAWRMAGGGAAVAARTEVESVETELPGAAPMIYQDEETGCTVIWIAGADDGTGGAEG